MEGRFQNRLKYIWRFGKKYVLFFIIAEVCILVSYAVSVLLPMNLTRLTDRVLYGGEFELLGSVIRDYCLLFCISTIFNFIYAFVWQYLNNHYVLDVKKEMYKKIVYAKSSFLSGSNSGDLMTRIDHDSEQFIHVVQRNLFHFINSAHRNRDNIKNTLSGQYSYSPFSLYLICSLTTFWVQKKKFVKIQQTSP